MILICDLQFFRDNDRSVIVKSFSCTNLYNNDIVNHFVFKPPFDFCELSLTRRAEAQHVSTHYHRINWNEGFIPYNEMATVVRSCLAEAKEVIVKGEEKAKYINTLMRRAICFDAEKLNCPNLKVLKAAESLFCNSPVSSLNVMVLKTWLQNFFQNTMEKTDNSIKIFNNVGLFKMSSSEIYFLPVHFLISRMEKDSLTNFLHNLPPHISQDISMKNFIATEDGFDEPDIWSTL